MARFRATISGQRGMASRLGSKKSGMVVTVNGWHKGITVVASVNSKDEDVFDIIHTKGSCGYDGTEGQDRESYSDCQDRNNYSDLNND